MDTRTETPVIPLAAQHFDELPDSARVNIKTVAAMEGISVATSWRWVAMGILPKPEPKPPGTNSTRFAVGKIRQSRIDRQKIVSSVRAPALAKARGAK